MRFYTVLQGRPQYYDRTPTSTAKFFASNSLAPHGATTRWTYTVPSGRKAFIESMQSMVLRDSVAGAAGQQAVYAAYTPSGGSQVILAAGINYGNAVNNGMNSIIGATGMIAAGDVIAGTTSDSSTTGAGTYFTNIKYTEFDA